MSQKKLADLNASSKDDFVAALANIFEYSPWIAEQAAAARPFAGVTQLFDAMKAAVDHAAPELRLALIKAHPDLADKTQRAAGLTAAHLRPVRSQRALAVFPDHLQDISALALQHGARGIERHADRRFGLSEWRHHQFHGFDLDIQ